MAISPSATLSIQSTPVTFALMLVKLPHTKEHYKRKLKEFFGFIGLPSNPLDEDNRAFLARTKAENINDNDINASNEYWVEDTILSFLDHQKERVDKGEFVENTLQAFYVRIRFL